VSHLLAPQEDLQVQLVGPRGQFVGFRARQGYLPPAHLAELDQEGLGPD
jgi:hypothetical protein